MSSAVPLPEADAAAAPRAAARPLLAFLSPVFLFPNDTGGRIRTTNILRGLKGGRFEVELLSPATPAQQQQWSREIAGVCDRFTPWPAPRERARWQRAFDLASDLPVNVANDDTAAARAAAQALAARSDIDLVVFDFVHSAVLLPDSLRTATVCFTHNVEAEIFARHAEHAPDALRRWMWRSQHAKMQRFESGALPRFTRVVAVSERDARQFRERYGLGTVEVIPTGVDLEYFAWAPVRDGGAAPTVVFTGSMDWDANVDGVGFFIQEVWPLVRARQPRARFVVVGRSPPASLLAHARPDSGIEFTGWVDDVRPHVRGAQAFVIPLRVGGGTRIKAFEAMAMGCPVVSTAVGIEGLASTPGEHHLEREEPAAFAEAVLALLEDGALRDALSRRARALVEARFGHREVARVFEDICHRALARGA